MRLYHIIMMMVLMACGQSHLYAVEVWQEANGVIVMEAEKGTTETSDTWAVRSDVSDYRGSGFIRWMGNNYFSNKTHGILSYKIKVTNPGNYHIRLRSFHDPVAHGETPDQENDCWTNFELNSSTKFHKTFRNQGTAGKPWSFDTRWEPTHGNFANPIVHLTAGEHTFRIAARSKNFMIDRIYLVKNTSSVTHNAAESQIINGSGAPSNNVSISGELRKWHKITLRVPGPNTSETADPNPFTNYRLDVTFSNGGSSYTVPGYYAADGNAAHSGATSGNVWLVHFTPDKTGTWNYSVSFKTGSNVAMNGGGSSAGFADGSSGIFSVNNTNKSGRDFRGKGRLQYVGEHYLRFAETGEYFLKQGPDAPENLLAYADFDGPFKSDGQKDNLIKTWSAHVGDWNSGDPSWKSGKGKGLIGALNYLAAEEMNAFSFLTMNIGGDDRNVFPYLDYNERVRMDCSRLAQWDMVFEHADKKGLYLHFKTQETENDQLLDGGALGNQRKLYYRELIARFGYHLALNWNIGEENTNSDAQRKQFAQYFYDNDPYRHHVVLHTYPGQKNSVYTPLLGTSSKYTGLSLQGSNSQFTDTFGFVKEWVDKSRISGKKWVVAVDEPGDAQHALVPDADDLNHDNARKNALWATFLAGGAGNEWYFGYGHAHSDLTCQDFRSRDRWWDHCRFALKFFKDNNIPVWQMLNDNGKSTASNDYCFYKSGEVYVIYLKNGGSTQVDLSGVSGSFSVRWFDPRNGGSLKTTSITSVNGGAKRSLGSAPNNTAQDWAILIQKSGGTTPSNQSPTAALTSNTNNGTAPVTINFSGAASTDSDGSISTYSWNFGDGTSANGVNVAHNYTVAGTYTATLTVTDDDGASDSASLTITVSGGSGGSKAITALYLVDAASDSDIRQLNNNDVINIIDYPAISIRAVASGNPNKVNFSLSGAQTHNQSEGVAPYALFGDTNGDYKVWANPSLGDYTLTVNADGVGAKTIHLTVIDDAIPRTRIHANGTTRIEVEDYDAGGFSDTTTGNSGNAYRNDDVDIEVCRDSGGGYNVGWIASNEWLEYSIDVEEAGTYQLDVRFARPSLDNNALHFELDGSDISAPLRLGVTGAWQNWDTASTAVDLPQGEHTLRLVTINQKFNLNWISFQKQQSNLAPQAAAAANILSGTMPLPVQFNANASSDADGSISSYAWDFGNGQSSSAKNPSHTFGAAGTYVVTLTVTDNEGASDTDTLSIVVDDAATPGEIVVAINAGGPAYTALDGTQYSADAHFTGSSKTYTTAAAIGGTEDDALYKSERYAPNLSYAIPLENGAYILTLQMAEIYFNAVNKRVFDVLIEGQEKEQDLDLFVETGSRYQAFDLAIPVSVIDGTLNIQLPASINNGKLSAIRVETAPAGNQ